MRGEERWGVWEGRGGVLDAVNCGTGGWGLNNHDCKLIKGSEEVRVLGRGVASEWRGGIARVDVGGGGLIRLTL